MREWRDYKPFSRSQPQEDLCGSYLFEGIQHWFFLPSIFFPLCSSTRFILPSLRREIWCYFFYVGIATTFRILCLSTVGASAIFLPAAWELIAIFIGRQFLFPILSIYLGNLFTKFLLQMFKLCYIWNLSQHSLRSIRAKMKVSLIWTCILWDWVLVKDIINWFIFFIYSCF